MEICDEEPEGAVLERFRTILVDEKPEIPEFVLEKLSIWDQDRAKRNKVMENHRRYYYGSMSRKNGELVHRVMLSDYKVFYVANKLYQQNLANQGWASNKQNTEIINRVAVEGLLVVLETSDGCVVFCKRHENLAYGDSFLHICPSGGFMPMHFKDIKAPNPFFSAVVQCRDELDIELTTGDLLYLGIVRDKVVFWNPTLVFCTQLNNTFSEVAMHFNNASDRWESEELLALKSGKNEIIRQVLENNEICRWAPTALWAILFFGRYKYGDHWYAKSKAEIEGLL